MDTRPYTLVTLGELGTGTITVDAKSTGHTVALLSLHNTKGVGTHFEQHHTTALEYTPSAGREVKHPPWG